MQPNHQATAFSYEKKIILLLMFAWLAMIVAVHAQPFKAGAARRIITPDPLLEECIRIGEALADEALRIIESADPQENPSLYCTSKFIRFPIESKMIRFLTRVDFDSFKRYEYISRTSLGEMTGEIFIEEALELIKTTPVALRAPSATC